MDEYDNKKSLSLKLSPFMYSREGEWYTHAKGNFEEMCGANTSNFLASLNLKGPVLTFQEKLYLTANPKYAGWVMKPEAPFSSVIPYTTMLYNLETSSRNLRRIGNRLSFTDITWILRLDYHCDMWSLASTGHHTSAAYSEKHVLRSKREIVNVSSNISIFWIMWIWV